MTISIDSPQPEQDRRKLLWRIVLWVVTALLLSFACAYVDTRLRNDIPRVFDPAFYIPAVLSSAIAAWCWGLLSYRTSLTGNLLAVFGSLIAPVLFFLIAIVVVVASLESHVQEPPPIAAGQDFGLEGISLENANWTKTLRQKFPTGSTEKKLVAELRSQGFRVELRSHTARFDYQINEFCREYLWVKWGLKPNGSIAAVNGTAGGMCL
ncbi:MAG: hypothetical protein ACTHPD_17395 [Rhizomicrobium sp.]